MTSPHARKIPAYGSHLASGQARVRLDGKDIYLGTFGSPESHQQYQRVISEWIANGYRLPTREQELTLDELIVRFMEHAYTYYTRANGSVTREYQALKYALRHLQKMYGQAFASDFGPLALRAVRQEMIHADLCRKLINSRVNRIRRMFKWGVEHQLISPSVLEGLRAVAPLRRGRSVNGGLKT